VLVLTICGNGNKELRRSLQMMVEQRGIAVVDFTVTVVGV
jgi:hypothetical protein